jgi:hypothetical protein
VAERIHLHRQLEMNVLALEEFDQPVENRFPVAVACKFIISDEEACDALFRLFPD